MKFLKIFRPNYSQKQYAADKDNEYLYDGFGHFNYSYEGHVLSRPSNIDRIEKQKKYERKFAAIIQIWLRKLIFKNQKEQIETNYEDLSTFHYPHTKQFLEVIALQKGSIHQTKDSTFKEMLIIILLIHDFFRRCLEFQTKIFIKFNSKNKTFLLHHEIECESEEM